MTLRNNGIITKGEYEKKSLEEAIKYAEEGGFTTRVTEVDGAPKMLDMSVVNGRINFRVFGGYVVEAYGG